jgi:hypothetical protein
MRRAAEAPSTSTPRTAAATNAQAAALAAAAKLRAANDGTPSATALPTSSRLRRTPSQRRTVEADLGPVRYLATLLGADNETVLRWFILVVALLLDLGAVVLLLAATRTRS